MTPEEKLQELKKRFPKHIFDIEKKYLELDKKESSSKDRIEKLHTLLLSEEKRIEKLLKE